MLLRFFHSNPVDASIWIIVGLLELMSVLATHRSEMFRQYVAFCIYLRFAVLKTALLMIIPFGPHWHEINFSWSVVQCGLIGMCVLSIYVKTFGPRIALPPWVPRKMTLWLAVVVVVSFGASILLRPEYGGRLIRLLGIIQEAIVIGSALTLWFFFIYSSRLGISWRPRVADLARGFAFTLTINAVTLGILGLFHRSFALPVQRVGQLAFIIALGYWNWTCWEKEPSPPVMTREMLISVTAGLQEVERTAEDLTVRKMTAGAKY